MTAVVERQMLEVFIVNRVGKGRLVTHGGKQWFVAPMVMINCDHGVLSGSRGPLLYTVEDTSSAVANWNGVPVCIDHPFDPETRDSLSASDDGVWERQGVGTVKNARFDGSKLKAEAWLDVARMQERAPEILNSLQRGFPAEISTGLYTEQEQAPEGATHNGKPYTYFARNHRPDHLALLSPGTIGACSLNDGCGLLVNAQAGGDCDDGKES